jgi:hypothetical protein
MPHSPEKRPAYLAANRERVRAQAREWYAMNKDRIREKNKAAAKARMADPIKKAAAYASTKAWYLRNATQVHERARARSYGWSVEQLREFLASHPKCGICGGPPDHIDHCHLYKNVRGMLCQNCNRGLGCFRDQTRILRAAIVYLLKTSGPIKLLKHSA